MDGESRVARRSLDEGGPKDTGGKSQVREGTMAKGGNCDRRKGTTAERRDCRRGLLS